MTQAFIEPDMTVDVIAWINEDDPRLRRMATFDAAVNNTDRKGGHILPVEGGRHVYGVDHGVCFSATPKLRTVLWAWRGEPLLADELAGLERIREALDGDLGVELRSLLSKGEVRATVRRVDELLARKVFPLPSPTWPAILAAHLRPLGSTAGNEKTRRAWAPPGRCVDGAASDGPSRLDDLGVGEDVVPTLLGRALGHRVDQPDVPDETGQSDHEPEGGIGCRTCAQDGRRRERHTPPNAPARS